MDLDDFNSFKRVDLQNMLGEIDFLPDQLLSAWKLGQTLPFPLEEEIKRSTGKIKQVVISGMGGSAIGADLLASYSASTCDVPVIVHRDYGLPKFARGIETLVIVSSHSGNTEETLDSFNTALDNQCRVLAITTGGELFERARKINVPFWVFTHHGMPRAAVGFSFGLLLAAFTRLGLISPYDRLQNEILSAVSAMKQQKDCLDFDIPIVKNPAKRLVGQLVGRWINIYASGALIPVARRWKGQIHEIAKAGAGFEMLPEADHNALAGLLNPGETLNRTMTIFLRAPSDHPRNRLRTDLTQHAFIVEGLNADFYDAIGDTMLAHMWTALHFGDYLSYYLAMAYDMNPTPVTALENLKKAMKAAKQS